jgi:hypothetical protein
MSHIADDVVSVPDLKILIRGEVAVAWGLNRMRAQQYDGRTNERGDRR